MPVDNSVVWFLGWTALTSSVGLNAVRRSRDGNHQIACIVRHNDESVREGYIRNSGKEVKLFTSALKDFQCNNRIFMAQRKHLDDFLRGRIIGRLEWGRTQLEVSEELGIAQSVIFRLWQQFQAPTAFMIRSLVGRFEELSFVVDRPGRGAHRNIRTEDNVVTMRWISSRIRMERQKRLPELLIEQ
ncbi:a disintegrin and metalloproteinase with thrombospondin motifs 7 [Trichonephila clavipes]|nr:a disintegrin and metalloproteinase with thrombospondin motifs 7 [Trichonephila clavipes]